MSPIDIFFNAKEKVWHGKNGVEKLLQTAMESVALHNVQVVDGPPFVYRGGYFFGQSFFALTEPPVYVI